MPELLRTATTWPASIETPDPQASEQTWNSLLASTEEKLCLRCRHWIALFLRLSATPPQRRRSQVPNPASSEPLQTGDGSIEKRPCQHGCCQLLVRSLRADEPMYRVYYHALASELSQDWDSCWICARLFTLKRSEQALTLESPDRDAYRALGQGVVLRYRIGEQKWNSSSGKTVLYGSIKFPDGRVLESDRMVFVNTTASEKRAGRRDGDLAFRTVAATAGTMANTGEQDDKMDITSRMERLHPNLLDPGRLAIVKRWREDCQMLHPACQTGSGSKQFLPKRLVSIGSSPGDVRLVYTADLSTTNLQYATLSHCWGPDPFVKLTQSNHARFCTRISEPDLALTFTESLELCRLLSIPYIWIDSFCIIQDSPADWAEQAPQMGSIYAASTLNLSAAASTAPSQGLVRPYDARVVERLRLLSSGRDLTEHSDPDHAHDHSRQPLYKRAWVAQERWLAPRELSFTRRQMVWYCRKALLLERAPARNIIHSQPEAVLRAPRHTDESSIAQAWATMVGAYSDTSATYARDRVVALAGLARVYEGLYAEAGLQNRFLAGLWQRNLGSWLRWSAVSCSATRATVPAIAPSWSWLAVEGRVKVVPLAASKQAGAAGAALVWQLEVRDYEATALDASVPTGALRARLVVESVCFQVRMAGSKAGGPLVAGSVPVRFRCYAEYGQNHECAITAGVNEVQWAGSMRLGGGKGELLEATTDARIVLQPDAKEMFELGVYHLVVTEMFRAGSSRSSQVRGIICEPVEHDDTSGEQQWRRTGAWDSAQLLSSEFMESWDQHTEQLVLV